MQTLRIAVAILAVVCGTAAAQTYTKTETLTYENNTSKWIIGQIATVTDVSTGLVQSSTTYDSTYAMPTTRSTFGALRQTLTYDTTSPLTSGLRGTLSTVKDGNNQTTALSGWKRGIPQTIAYPDGFRQSAEVNDWGLLTSVTDENGFTTSYGYDAMGRLASIAHPAGDTVVWTNTTRSLLQVASAEYAIAAGHWRETVTTGNAVKITHFDGMWRPLLVREYDAASQATTERFTRMSYDVSGRLAFKSYPATHSAPTTGVWMEYDPLNRPTSSTQDSELGPLTTLMAYGTGFTTTVTNPKTHATTTSYMTYDQPSTDWPITINAPASVTTAIARDTFGKPTAITRAGAGTSVTRSYTYNTAQELCRTVEPETGATLMGYDAAGNLSWSSAGLPSGTPCESYGSSGPVAARRVLRSYDARNRLTTLAFPDGNGNQTWTYTPDGLPASVSTLNGGNTVTNAYSYNRRRLMVSESMVPDATYTGWAIGYGYNSLGHVVAETHPGNAAMNYIVNALGQTIQISAGVPNQGTSTVVASNASYFPNGALKQFTYGNGIVHTMTQNARQLPSRSTDGTVLDLGTSFDANGNVASVTDYATGKQTKTMGYDALDRLTSATSPMFGTATYSYDSLDNFRQVQIAGAPSTYGADRTHYYCYNAANQLEFVRTGSDCNSSPAVINLGYDAQGNVLNKNGAFHTFDYGNRLRTTAGVTYRYDAEGRRVRQDNAGSQLIYSFYAKDGRLVWQRDDQTGKRLNNVYLAGSLVAEFSRPTLSTTETLTYVHTDALGSPIARTNSAGSVIQTSEYEPYGKLLNRPNDDRPGYTGHVMDSASGLTYMQQRYYDPAIGRFLSVDPVTADATTGDNFNRYKYAANNPYRFTDPDGRQEMGAERFNDAFAKDPAAFKPFEPIAIAVTLTAVALTPIVGPELATLARVAIRNSAKEDVPNGVPKGWDRSASNKGGGERFTNPANKHDQVRSMPGNPRSSNPAQQSPYVTRQADGKSYNAAGKEVPRASAEAHIPKSEFRFIPKEELNKLNR